MSMLDELEHRWTLSTAVVRYDELRTRDSLADPNQPDDQVNGCRPLSRAEALELLALGEVIARKAGYGRQLAVRTARATGASWAQIGQALGNSRQSAWEAHTRWIDAQAQQHDATGYEGLDDAEVARIRALAGTPAEQKRP